MTLDNTTICIFFRMDNQYRLSNLDYILAFYYKHIDNPKVIVYVEKTDKLRWDQLNFVGTEYANATLIISRNEEAFWNKCKGYNAAAGASNTPIICYNDVDVVVDVNQLKEGEEYLLANDRMGLLYPYDGRFLCVDKELRSEFGKCLELDKLKQYEPPSWSINSRSEHVFVGHNNSPGGIVMARKDNIAAAGGYNELFKGWGYEDSEILSRMKILGYGCGRVMTGPCWHLDHTDGDSSPKEYQAYHEDNRSICHKIESMNKEQLKQYIQSADWQKKI